MRSQQQTGHETYYINQPRKRRMTMDYQWEGKARGAPKRRLNPPSPLIPSPNKLADFSEQLLQTIGKLSVKSQPDMLQLSTLLVKLSEKSDALESAGDAVQTFAAMFEAVENLSMELETTLENHSSKSAKAQQHK